MIERLGLGAPLIELGSASSKRRRSIIRGEYVLFQESMLAWSNQYILGVSAEGNIVEKSTAMRGAKG